MRTADQMRHDDAPILEHVENVARDAGARFTPGEFLRDAGGFIVGCLGLGLLMRFWFG